MKIKSVKGEAFKPSDDVKSHAEVDLKIIENTESGTMHTDTTVTGSGGSATVDPKKGSVYWKVKPNTSWPYQFVGTLEVDYYSGESDTYILSGAGALGNSVSDTVQLDHSGGYSVYLSGTATAINGVKYVVLPGCETGYGV